MFFLPVEAVTAHLGNLILNGMAIYDVEEAWRCVGGRANGNIFGETWMDVSMTTTLDGTLKVSLKCLMRRSRCE